MKANELMIGNIVGYSSLTRMVTAINPPYFIDLGNGERTTITNVCIEHLNPIPITEELLLKNGFERNDKHSFHLRVKPCYTLYLVKPKDSQPWFCKVYGCGADDNHSIKALYLHQYQNLCNIAGVEMEWKV